MILRGGWKWGVIPVPIVSPREVGGGEEPRRGSGDDTGS